MVHIWLHTLRNAQNARAYWILRKTTKKRTTNEKLPINVSKKAPTKFEPQSLPANELGPTQEVTVLGAVVVYQLALVSLDEVALAKQIAV
jgi:hypothetical protein